MKKAVILHGTDGKPEDNWFPWLKSKLEAAGYDVWVPLLPENRTPNRVVYGSFFLGSGSDFTDPPVIGQSSGAVEVLNLLMDERCPKIKFGLMVSAWATNEAELSDTQKQVYAESGLSKEQFANLFPPEGFDFELIKSKADKLAFLHGDDDPYCPLEQAQYLANQLDATITVVPNGHHLGKKFTELPQVWDIIQDLGF